MELQQVKLNTGDMLASLSTAQREVARTAPWLGSSQSNGVALMHAPYVLTGGSGSVSMVPNGDRFGLPVQDDPFQKACDRGNSIVGKLAQLLIPAELTPILQMLDWGEAHKLPAQVCMGKPGSGDPDDLFNEDDVCDDVVGNAASEGAQGNGGGDDDDDDEKACKDDYEEKKNKHMNGGGESLFDQFDPNNKSTKGPYGPVRNGDDFFQVYSVVTGDTRKIERSNKGVEAPTWGGATVESVGAGSDESIAVAQAEFYYDQTRTAIVEDGCWQPCPAGLTWESYRENTLWNLRWRARLRRYRMPQNVEFNVLTQVIPAIDIEFQSGLDPYNASVNKGPALFNSTAVADKTGEGAFIGGGTYLIH